ncbi:MAG: hypothetical protein MJE77_34785 [Proteobacteria bacterium]|nr:hypothetical protein [Pseudomonadota bacterium]
MTSSATQTDNELAADAADDSDSSGDLAVASAEPGEGGAAARRASIPLIIFAALLAVGWLGIFYANSWHFGPPVFFLFAGWLAVLLIGHYLWKAGLSAALDTGDDEDDFWQPVGHRDELLREKRSLLKAIKEIEFDHQMGKMSDKDAQEIASLYRARAIAVIKALEQDERDGEKLSVSDRIENEVKARLTVASAVDKGKSAGARSSGRASPGGQKKTDEEKAGTGKADNEKAGEENVGNKSAPQEASSAEVGS